ncbi:EamA family transporter [Roseospira marina]|uniref:EamA family transporter n=1 Tax=Roseospira marina TaxID=140057 RepID=A0A5M6IIM5_9PROT|nr:EamA family transporter [Roseospira marina]KAA5607545.1 EamA family transporter [Roseospira marina]MBB4312268.1 O-acetylserine/cysteine efflux transporter [Roseospira marina]MBB5085716.1 O-acetylserine/cysteine efflux transporter [Roseospira marina]
MPVTDILLALLVQGLWGLNFIAAKVGADNLPPLMFTAIRFLIVAVLVVPFVPRPRGAALRSVLVLSLTFGTLHFGILFSAMRYVDAATAAVIIQTGPPFSVLLGILIFKEVIGWRRILGLVLAFSGVIVVAGEPNLPSLLPVTMLLFAAFAWAMSNAVVKFSQGLSALAMTGWLCLLAIPQVTLLSWLFEDGHVEALYTAPWKAWACVLFSAIGASLIAHSLWYALVRRHPMTVIAPWGLLAPILGIASGILILGEPATWQKVVGGAITLTGVGIVQIRSAVKGRPVGTGPECPECPDLAADAASTTQFPESGAPTDRSRPS